MGGRAGGPQACGVCVRRCGWVGLGEGSPAAAWLLGLACEGQIGSSSSSCTACYVGVKGRAGPPSAPDPPPACRWIPSRLCTAIVCVGVGVLQARSRCPSRARCTPTTAWAPSRPSPWRGCRWGHGLLAPTHPCTVVPSSSSSSCVGCEHMQPTQQALPASTLCHRCQRRRGRGHREWAAGQREGQGMQGSGLGHGACGIGPFGAPY